MCAGSGDAAAALPPRLFGLLRSGGCSDPVLLRVLRVFRDGAMACGCSLWLRWLRRGCAALLTPDGFAIFIFEGASSIDGRRRKVSSRLMRGVVYVLK